MADRNQEWMVLARAIAAGESARALRLFSSSPALLMAQLQQGATRDNPTACFLDAIEHQVYEGDTALHVAAAAYDNEVVAALLAKGASTQARNRRGAVPLHYAVDGNPVSTRWNPAAQVATVAKLLAAGADVNAVDVGGVTPLHRAVRNRCASVVRLLLERGADATRKNKSGSTPLQLAAHTTGRGGTGSAAAKAELVEIVRLLRAAS
jgi:ankyrin repeat protein